jgi:hypothetical protein
MRRSEQAALGGNIVQRALEPLAAEAPDVIAELITMSDGRRPALEAAGSMLVARLHRASDDFDATRALCAVNAALSRIGWEMPTPPVRGDRRGRRRS